MSLVENKLKYFSVVTIGVGSFILISHAAFRTITRWRLTFLSRKIIHNLKEKLQNPLPSTSVVSSHSQWESVYPTLLRDCQRLPVLGFDCEWVNTGGKTQPVALIQLASLSGACALVRVNCMGALPITLQTLLADPRVLKVGVATWEDSLKVARDLQTQMAGVVDVRYLLHHRYNSLNTGAAQGLGGLSQSLLQVSLPKHFSVRCSDWEAEQLTCEQIDYAAKDALASLAIYLRLVQNFHLKTVAKFKWSVPKLNEVHEATFTIVRGFADRKYHDSNKKRTVAASQSKTKTKTINTGTVIKSRSYATRKTPLYDNCILQAPDGQPLCTCDVKKAQWYVNKGRGEYVNDNPLTVRLNFEPSGRPDSDYDAYYLIEKSNQCVVCGQTESYLRKNIVPHEYRRHFPADQKDHKSHDILLLCETCHARSNMHDLELRLQLANECSAPLSTAKDSKVKLDKRLSSVQRAARAVSLNRSSIPQGRIEELEKVIRDFYGVEEVTSEILEAARNLETSVENPDYVPHGLKVVERYENTEGILELEKKWRQHFLESMNPRFLPAMWSVEHHRKPEESWKARKESAE